MNMYKRDDQPEGFDWLADVKGYSAYLLASEYAGCASPDGHDSPGAVMLTELRDEIVEAWEGGEVFDLDSARYDTDNALKLAGETLPDYTHQVMLRFVDVSAYQEQSPFSANGEWGPGTFEDMARQALGEILERMAMALVTEIRTTWEGLECSDCNGPWADCRDGCVQAPEVVLADVDDMHPDAQITGYRWSPEVDAEPADTATQGPGADEVTQAVPEAAGHLNDPLYQLLTAKPGTTQAFMANMAEINREEFGRIRLRRARIKLALVIVGLAVYVGLVFLTMGGGK